MLKNLLCFLICLIFISGIAHALGPKPPPPTPPIPRDENVNDHWRLLPPNDWATQHFDFAYPYSVRTFGWGGEEYANRIGSGMIAENEDGTSIIAYSWLHGQIRNEVSFGPDQFNGFFISISKLKNIHFDIPYIISYFKTISGRCVHPIHGTGTWKLTFDDHGDHCHVVLAIRFGEQDSNSQFQEMGNYLLKDEIK